MGWQVRAGEVQTQSIPGAWQSCSFEDIQPDGASFDVEVRVGHTRCFRMPMVANDLSSFHIEERVVVGGRLDLPSAAASNRHSAHAGPRYTGAPSGSGLGGRARPPQEFVRAWALLCLSRPYEWEEHEYAHNRAVPVRVVRVDLARIPRPQELVAAHTQRSARFLLKEPTAFLSTHFAKRLIIGRETFPAARDHVPPPGESSLSSHMTSWSWHADAAMSPTGTAPGPAARQRAASSSRCCRSADARTRRNRRRGCGRACPQSRRAASLPQ